MSHNNYKSKTGHRRRPLRFLFLFIHEGYLRLFCRLLANLPNTIQTSLRVPAALNLCNPSILRFKNNWLVLARQHNYYFNINKELIVKSGWTTLYSHTWLLNCDDDLNIVQASCLTTCDAVLSQDECRNGLEDPRLFAVEDRLFVIWSGLKLDVSLRDDRDQTGLVSERLPDGFRAKNTMIMAEIKDEVISQLILLPSPHGLLREKNWIPVALNSVIYLIYSLCRMEVYRLGLSGLELVHLKEKPYGFLEGWSGSSQIIEWDGNFLCVAHAKRWRVKTVSKKFARFYTHRLLLISPSWRVIAHSAEFCFESRGIEFCSGLAKDGDRVIFSYGIEDCAAALLEISCGQVNNLLGRRGSG